MATGSKTSLFKMSIRVSSHLVAITPTTWGLIIQKYFCAVYYYAGKADLSKGYGNPKRKLGVTMHFKEIIKKE